MNAGGLSAQLALLPDYLGNHLLLTILALGTGILLCLPLGFAVTRLRPLQWPVLSAAGVLQTIPGLALLALMVPLLGTIGFIPALVALTLYSFLPILRNTVTGILGVDASVREAARGMGMTDAQLLFSVELPLALPIIVAGIRTAAVWVVGTATLATPVGATSLGNYIFSGLQTQNLAAVLVGCTAAAVLALALDGVIRLVETAARRRSRRLAVVSAGAVLALLVGGLAPWMATRGASHSSPAVVIGSKPFTEQYVLAALLGRRLERAGFRVERRPGMGSLILFDALIRGEVDAYVDYSGTIWANVMKRDDVLPRGRVLEEMTAFLERTRGVAAVGALGFENTYALAVRRGLADSLGLAGLGDLARVSAGLDVGGDYEFFSRPEWEALRDGYGLRFRRQRTFDPSLLYEAAGRGEVDVISAYSTDGRIADFDLVPLRDPRQVLPPYDAVLLLSPRAAADARLREALRPLLGRIDAEAMREANRLVDQEGRSPDSAAAWLDRRIQAASP